MLNNSNIQGRFTTDPELKKTNEGVSVCSFTLACDRSFVRQGEERQADFIDCVAWRQQAEFISKYFTKGSLVIVTGTIQTRNWEDKNGTKRKTTELVVSQVNFSESKKESKPALGVEVEDEIKEVPDTELPF